MTLLEKAKAAAKAWRESFVTDPDGTPSDTLLDLEAAIAEAEKAGPVVTAEEIQAVLDGGPCEYRPADEHGWAGYLRDRGARLAALVTERTAAVWNACEEIAETEERELLAAADATVDVQNEEYDRAYAASCTAGRILKEIRERRARGQINMKAWGSTLKEVAQAPSQDQGVKPDLPPDLLAVLRNAPTSHFEEAALWLAKRRMERVEQLQLLVASARGLILHPEQASDSAREAFLKVADRLIP